MTDKLVESLGPEWYVRLKGEFEKDYMKNLREFIAHQMKITTVYPLKDDVFNAYKLTPYSKARVCIVGQDEQY